jgi:hypothetical protein
MSFIPTDYSQIQKQLKAEKENSYWGGYFKTGVYGGTPTQKKAYSGRILPAFKNHINFKMVVLLEPFFPVNKFRSE